MTNRGRDWVDNNDPRANMYGCTPCPECGSVYRWPTPTTVVCDDCDGVWERIDIDRADGDDNEQ